MPREWGEEKKKTTKKEPKRKKNFPPTDLNDQAIKPQNCWALFVGAENLVKMMEETKIL